MCLDIQACTIISSNSNGNNSNSSNINIIINNCNKQQEE